MWMTEAGLFKGISQRAVQKIGSECIDESYEQGSTIFRAGEEANFFYILAEGTVEVSAGARQSIQFTVSRPGAVVGLSALVDPYRYNTTASAKTFVRAVKVPREAIEQVLKKYPDDGLLILRHLIALMAQRLVDAYEYVTPEAVLLRVP
jgi:CRP-like cAMP-binding protein